MKKLLFSIILLIFGTFAFAQVKVKGYYRKNGTYVQPHVRSSPDGNPYNNYSYPVILTDLSKGIEGSSLVNYVETSTTNTTIINDTRGQGNLTSLSGDQVRWNPNSTAGGPDQTGSTSRPSFLGLGHECCKKNRYLLIIRLN